MQKLLLHCDEVLNGKFSLKKLNFLFVFQVNCPGCFLYGFPMMDNLHKEFKNDISFLGISTAFEDFEYNNEKNTRLLLEHREVVGETKKAFSQQGLEMFPHPISFPIAMDEKAHAEFDYQQAAARLCELDPHYATRSASEQAAMNQNALRYLKGQEMISLTFTLNQLRGTPTFLLITDTNDILHHSFGHMSYPDMKNQLKHFVDKFN